MLTTVMMIIRIVVGFPERLPSIRTLQPYERGGLFWAGRGSHGACQPDPAVFALIAEACNRVRIPFCAPVGLAEFWQAVRR
jgi:hypothetical protein